MVLDLRSRVDIPENLNDNNANSDSIIIIDSANYSGYGDTRVASKGGYHTDPDRTPISIPLPLLSAPKK